MLEAIFSVPVLFSPWLCGYIYNLDYGEKCPMTDCFIHCSNDSSKLVASTNIESWRERERERG